MVSMNATTSRVESSVQVFSYSQNNKSNLDIQLNIFLLLLNFALLSVIVLRMMVSAVMLRAGNTKGESITVPLTSCLTVLN